MRPRLIAALTIATAWFALATAGHAQANLPIYTDNLVNGFQDWGWGTRSFTNTSPTHSGSTNSISAWPTSGPGISLHQNNVNTSPYASVSFWANGGTNGGQVLQVYVTLGSTDQPAYTCSALTAATWTQFTIPLSSLGAANKTNLTRVNIKFAGGSTGVFYLDDLQLNAAPAPALVHLTVDANQTLRAVDTRLFGVNTATWDGYLGNAQTAPLMRQIGITTLRWPGGSTSDGYHWTSDATGNTTFNKLATNIGAKVFITVNYGSGTSNEAAAWVKSVNVTNHFGFKYWEIGNECYGTWETDNNTTAPYVAHDPWTYASRAAGYMALMRAADPTIKIGVVAVPGEDSNVNNNNHPVVNPRTGATHYGWTPVMLYYLNSLGAIPDFLIYHVYPQWTDPNANPKPVADSDALVLQASGNWAGDAADLRQQLTDYLGASGAGVELVCTENNSDSGGFGRQLTSIVNGLYLADNMAAIMKTEFNGLLWWDFRNGQGTTGTFDPTIYGWRTYGDEGIVGGASSPLYPTFYAEKLMQYFARAGDTVLNPTSDYLLLSAYGVRKTNGALTLLVINKDVTAPLTAQVNLAGFAPASTATVRAFGITQDEATRTNNPAPGSQDISTNTVPVGAVFTNTFPAGSLTLFTLTPAPAKLVPVSVAGGQFVFQLQGQPGTPYILQSSTNLNAPGWISVSTNTLVGSSLNVTNPLAAGTGQKFWRAVWQP